MRLLRRIALALFAGLAVLELALQLAALIASRSGPSAPGGSAPVLCIGDSYTYGLGATATERSYPGVLQVALRQQLAGAPAVVNAGWPGQNSREALLRLDRQLEEQAPQLVCVLIGLNDSWTRPRAVGAEELAHGEDAGFVWRFRTWRLLQLLWRESPAEAAPPAPPAPPPADAPGGDSFTVASRAVALVRAGKPDEAIAVLEAAIAGDPANAPEYQQGLVQIHTKLGRRDRAAAALDWLRERHRTAPSQAVAEALATSLHAVGDRRAAAELAIAGTDRFPQSSTLWWIASQFHYDTGDFAAAERELDRAIATASPRNREWLAALHRDLARACCVRDLGKALRAMVEAMRIDGDVERCRLVVDGAPQAFGREALARCLPALALEPQDQERLQRLLGSGWADRSDMCGILRDHLRQIVQRCRDRGAQVVVLGYPLAVDDVEAVQREVAAALGVPFVPCQAPFAAALARRAREELYVRDGHCTDAGYALMAEAVLPAVLAALRR